MAPSYDVQKLETHRPLPAAAGRGSRSGPRSGPVSGPQHHHVAAQGHAQPHGAARQQTLLYALADREPVCRLGVDGLARRTRHSDAGQGAGPPFGLYPRRGNAGSERTSRRGVRRHRRGLQHGHRHGHRAERHSARPERQGRRQGRGPHCRDRRFACRRAKDSPEQRRQNAARTARHDGPPRSRTAGHLRPGRGRGRARRHSHQEHRIGLPHRRRRGVRQAGAVRADHFRRIPQGAGIAARRRGDETDFRPAGQFRRVPRSPWPTSFCTRAS